ncbi:MAG: PDZ domain-containing protein [Candidatus Omnitrophota bacterium]
MIVIIICCPCFSHADTIQLKDNTVEKGIVVENYHDRLILSTIDGEKEVKKRDIKDLEYDRLEQNLVAMGDLSYQKDNIIKAFEYYEKAYYINPDYKEAKDKFLHMRSVLQKRPEEKIKSDVDRRRSIFMKSGRLYEPQDTAKISKTLEWQFRKAVGLVLEPDNYMPKVTMVVAASAGDKAGFMKGDIIYSVWGRLTGYFSLENIISMILESPSREVAFTARRKILIAAGNSEASAIDELGFSLGIKEDGLYVSEVKERSLAAKSGLYVNDIVTDINSENTRYMPLKDAVTFVNRSAKAGKVELCILRDIVLWKEE